MLLLLAFLCCNAQPPQELDANFRLYIGSRNGDFQAMNAALLSGANINSIGDRRSGQTAMVSAALSGRQDIVEWLLERGADPNVPDATGQTVWTYACSLGLVNLAQILARMNIDPHRTHPDDDIPTLHRCAAVKRTSLLEPVLKSLFSIKGINVDYPNKAHGVTPLMAASKYGNLKMIEILIQHGAKVNKQDKEGRVPLIYAIQGLTIKDESDTHDGRGVMNQEEHRKNFLEVLKLLLKNGADPSIESIFHETPIALVRATCYQDMEISELFENTLNTRLNEAIKKNKPKPSKVRKVPPKPKPGTTVDWKKIDENQKDNVKAKEGKTVEKPKVKNEEGKQKKEKGQSKKTQTKPGKTKGEKWTGEYDEGKVYGLGDTIKVKLDL